MPAPKSILDTNVVVSGVLNPERPAGRVLEQVVRGTVPTVLSSTLVAEYTSALRGRRLMRRHELSPDDIELFVAGIEARAELIDPGPSGLRAPDDRDQHLWDLLVAVLVTGERRLLGNAPPGREVLST